MTPVAPPICRYCRRLVVEGEWGYVYSIKPEDESLEYFHIECVEVTEGIQVLDSLDDDW